MNLLDLMKRSSRPQGLILMLLALCTMSLPKSCWARHIVLIDRSANDSIARKEVEEAANFYGLEAELRVADTRGGARDLISALRLEKPLALILTVDVLPLLDRQNVMTAVGRKAPILIVGVNENTEDALLRMWSDGAVVGCRRKTVMSPGWYAIAKSGTLVKELAGSRLPLTVGTLPYLLIRNIGDAKWVMEAETAEEEMPVFEQTSVGDAQVYFATDRRSAEPAASPDPYRQQAVFARLAPALLFLKYAGGEYAWHSPKPYANFTIDDLWLREPYGHVNYEELLEQSKLHNFHSTIAFIPWNFDRSDSAVAALFRSNPDRLSVCIHGNDHIHQEFGSLESHPLIKQMADLRQGLARMERFHQLTGVSSDAVMVFPHSVSPGATFDALQQYNYLATANSLNVPSDETAPTSTEFALRTATLQFGGFPSLRRYSVESEVPRAQLAIDAFLGNPMLFYGHESFFSTGIGAFNKTADEVNALQPGTEWRGLGDIVRHLYLERLREDGDYDIRAYSNDILLTNVHGRDAVYHVGKYASTKQRFVASVNGNPYELATEGSTLQIDLPMANGASREVTIRTVNTIDLAKIDVRRHSLRTNVIRLLSDFRDNTVSRSGLGRWFIRSYAENGRPWNLAMILIAAGTMGLVTILLARRQGRLSRSRVAGMMLEKAH